MLIASEQTKDLSEKRVCMEAGNMFVLQNGLWRRLSETSICNESIRLWRKHGWKFKANISVT